MTHASLRTVLYVDDHPDICEVVQSTLCLLAGLEVRTAQSGQQAIDLAFEQRPDLILMDVMMPGLDGPATLRRLRERRLLRDIPVAFMTAKVLPEEVAKFLALGAIGVIPKPFDPDQLCRQVLTLWRGVAPAAGDPRADIKPSPAPSPDAALVGQFLDRTAGDVKRLRALIESACQQRLGALGEIEQLAHSLHGAAAMFGYPALSTACGVIEQLAARGGGAVAAYPPGNGVLQELLSRAEQLAVEMQRAIHAEPGGALFQGGGGSR